MDFISVDLNFNSNLVRSASVSGFDWSSASICAHSSATLIYNKSFDLQARKTTFCWTTSRRINLVTYILFINNRIVAESFVNQNSRVGSKVWDWQTYVIFVVQSLPTQQRRWAKSALNRRVFFIFNSLPQISSSLSFQLDYESIKRIVPI